MQSGPFWGKPQMKLHCILIYLEASPYRTITYVAQQLKNSENYDNFSDVQKEAIESFIK